MADLPTGTITFLFTDIEGSTRLLQELGPDRYRAAQDLHAEILRGAISTGGGTEIRTEGDSFFAVFPTAAGALAATVAAQRGLGAQTWPEGASIRVRMGLHTGEGRRGGDDYVGIDVNRAARIGAAGHGGQVLMSETTRTLVEHDLPEGVSLRDLGRHRLKDIEYAEHLSDVAIDGLPADFAPIRSVRGLRTNLPPQRTSFVGREREVAEIGELLSRTRLLTLTGPGGTGKTRLALRVAAEHLESFADGVFLVDLAAVADPDLVPSRIASSLGIPEDRSLDPLERVARHLADREILLVVDNVEHVVGAAPHLGRLVDAVPHLSIMATSRVPLHLSGEQEYHVEPLALPATDGDSDVPDLMRSDSVLLFADRAATGDPRFRIDDGNASLVADIVRRVDGLPLAIELAAAHVKLLSPAELLARLEHRLPLLTGGPNDAPDRQRTLRATIGWSHDLLGPEEQRLFARLAAFRGGSTLGSAEAVCGPGLSVPVLQGLGSLLDASLLRREQDRGQGTRFGMLETILEYATERLTASAEFEEMRTRHAGHMRDLAEEAEPHLMSEGQFRWMERLEAEHDNMRAALDWGEMGGDVEAALRTAAALWRFWLHQGYLTEARRRLERLLALPDAQARTRARARALGALGGVAYWQADYSAIRGPYEEAADIAREIGDRRLHSRTLYDLSFVASMENDMATADALLDDALAEAADDDAVLRAQIWGIIGRLRARRGDLAGAIGPAERSLAFHRGIGDRDAIAEDLIALTSIKLLVGDFEAAWALLREAVSHFAELGSTEYDATKPARRSRPLAVFLVGRAVLANNEGDYRLAARLLGAFDRGKDEGGGAPPSFALDAFGNLDAPAREALGEDAYERAREAGYAMTADEAWAALLAEASSAS